MTPRLNWSESKALLARTCGHCPPRLCPERQGSSVPFLQPTGQQEGGHQAGLEPRLSCTTPVFPWVRRFTQKQPLDSFPRGDQNDRYTLFLMLLPATTSGRVGWGWGLFLPLLLSTLVIATVAPCHSSRETAHSLHAKEPLSDAELWLLEHIPPPPDLPTTGSWKDQPV